MQERENLPNFKEQYKGLSPLERNNIYRQFWQELPFHVFRDETGSIEDFVEQTTSTLERRGKSQTLNILTQKLEALLSFAPTIDSFREYIVEGYITCYTFGAEKDKEFTYSIDPLANTLLWTLDSENPQSEGLFGEKAKEFAGKAYKQKLLDYFWNEKLSETVTKKAFPYEKYDEIRNRIGESRDEKMLKKWRQEFVEKYNDEP